MADGRSKLEQLSESSIVVHKSLQDADLAAGVGLVCLLAIISLTVVLVFMVHVAFVALGILLYVICRILCKDDAYMVEMVMSNLASPTYYEG